MWLYPLFQCNCISNTAKTTFLNIAHVSQCHLQLLEESEFCFSVPSQAAKLVFFGGGGFKGNLFNSCVKHDRRNGGKTVTF